MSDQAYGGDHDPYWLSSRGVRAVNFNNNENPPAAYLGKSILYTMDDFNLYFNGQRINGGGGGGGVSGPDSSTDKAIARWDGTDGDRLLDSSVVISDGGVMGELSGITFAESTVNPGGMDTMWMDNDGDLWIGGDRIGGVVGPASSDVGMIPIWNDTNGTVLAQSGCSAFGTVLNSRGLNLDPVLSLFNLTAANNKFDYRVDGIDYSFRIPIGQYNGGSLAAAIQELMTEAGVANVSYSANAFTIATTESAILLFGGIYSLDSVGPVLGFPIADTTNAFTHTGSATRDNDLLWVESSSGHLFHGDVDLEGAAGAATALATTGADVVVNAAAPPTAGKVLIATSATNAEWGNVNSGDFIDFTTAIVGNSDPTKKLKFYVGFASTGTTTTLQTYQTADRTLILPNVDGNLIADVSANTMTNKTFVANSCRFIPDSDPNKQLSFIVGGSSATITYLATNSTANRTLTLPDVTDTLVGKTTTDLLTNKSLSDSTTFIVDSSVNTKRLGFDITGNANSTVTLAVSAGYDYTITLPSGNDTLIGRSSTDTIYNKTLTDASNNIMAKSLKSATTTIDVSAATAPSAGQVLTASSSTAAIWSTPRVQPFGGLYLAGNSGSGVNNITLTTSNTYYPIVTSGTITSLVGGAFDQSTAGRLRYASGSTCTGAVVHWHATVTAPAANCFGKLVASADSSSSTLSGVKIAQSQYSTIGGTIIISSLTAGDTFEIQFSSSSASQTIGVTNYGITVVGML